MNAALTEKITRLCGSFESLETFFFRRSVEKAFQLDEPSFQHSGAPTTTVIDDVMFVLKKVLDRAMSTADANLIRIICANTRRILDLDFAGVIKRRSALDSQLSSGKSDDGGQREKLRSFIAGLNNLEMSSESVMALTKGYLAYDFRGIFPFEGHAKITEVAIMNLGNLKERFDSYLHVFPFLIILILGRIGDSVCTVGETRN